MTDEAKRYAETYLESCALGYAASVQACGSIVEQIQGWQGAKAALHDAGVKLAAALGNLDAAERAELEALRRFREGVLALRGELASGERTTPEDTIETIDALELMNQSPPGAKA